MSDTKAPQGLGPKAKLQRARNQDERATIIDGLDHEVGFAKPPKATRFQPGRSGNPRGRRKGDENLRTVVKEVLSAEVEINHKGKRRKMSTQRLITRRMAQKGMQGDLKAMDSIIKLAGKAGLFNQPEQVDAPVVDARDLEAINRFAEFLGAVGLSRQAAVDAAMDDDADVSA
jgi:hypothetical protein